MRRIIALLLCLTIVCPISSHALAQGTASLLLDEGFELMATHGATSLYFHSRTGEIAVEDANGFLWRSAVTDQCDTSTLTTGQKANAAAPLILEYTLLNSRNGQSERTAISQLGLRVSHEAIPGGVRATYAAEDIAAAITVEYTLEDNALHVAIPRDGIVENIGNDEKLQKSMANIKANIDWVYEILDGMQSDPELSRHTKQIARFRKAFTQYAEHADSIVSVIDIKNEISKATALMESCQAMFKGGVGETGLFNEITADESISAATRKKYSGLYKQMDGKFTQTKLLSQQLSAIKCGGITAISLLPNFGALGDYESGYVFYPDGSGAISYASPEHPSYQSYYLESIYSRDSSNLWELFGQEYVGTNRVLMPVFGVKHGSSAYVAVVDTGAENAAIEYNPSGLSLNVHRVDAYLRCRRTSTVYENGQSRGTIYEAERFDTDYKVSYFFLQDDAADYSGMACRYRQYLLEHGQLRRSSLIGNAGTVALNLIMGVTKQGMIADQYIVATSFDQVQEMTAALKAAGVEHVLMNLRGYTRPGHTKEIIAKPLGGEKGLTALAASLEGSDMKIFLDNDFTMVSKSDSHFSTQDYAYDNTGTFITEETRSTFLLNPTSALNYVRSIRLPELGRLGVDGMIYGSNGFAVYYDYQPQRGATRTETLRTWQQMLGETRQTLGYSAAIIAGAYTFNNIDWVVTAPNESTGYVFTDESVPFYQMVLHGYVLYSDKSFNRFYDPQYETMKALENGSMPMFDLTHVETSQLKNTNWKGQFSTCFADWKDQIAKVSQQFSAFDAVADCAMVKHERLEHDVTRVTYENGMVLVLNYGSETITLDGVTIDAMDYHLFTKGGNEA